MRIVFQCYSIYAAFIATVLTGALAFGLPDAAIETVARSVINVSYQVFGPVLMIFVYYGFAHFKGLAFVCSPRGATHHINFADIGVLLFTLVLAVCITFTILMQKTMDMAN